MKKPNIFSYANSELSQDAFLAWLAMWANETNESDASMHSTGIEFVKTLISLQEKDFNEEITHVEVKRQWQNADVCLWVNRRYLVIIEDKTSTLTHSGQLQRYKTAAEKWCEGNKDYTLICVYYKSENQSLHNFANVTNAEYVILTREKMLYILKSCKSDNVILQDYREHLQSIDDETNSYLILPVSQWGKWGKAWRGFYCHLQQTEGFEGGRWYYVPNESGGFFGFAWNYYNIEPNDASKCKLYLQIENGVICVKICDIVGNKSNIRNKVSSIVVAESKGVLVRPKNFGHGKTMTIAKMQSIKNAEKECFYTDLIAQLKSLTQLINSMNNIKF